MNSELQLIKAKHLSLNPSNDQRPKSFASVSSSASAIVTGRLKQIMEKHSIPISLAPSSQSLRDYCTNVRRGAIDHYMGNDIKTRRATAGSRARPRWKRPTRSCGTTTTAAVPARTETPLWKLRACPRSPKGTKDMRCSTSDLLPRRRSRNSTRLGRRGDRRRWVIGREEAA